MPVGFMSPSPIHHGNECQLLLLLIVGASIWKTKGEYYRTLGRYSSAREPAAGPMRARTGRAFISALRSVTLTIVSNLCVQILPKQDCTATETQA